MIQKDWDLLITLTSAIANKDLRSRVVKELNNAPTYFKSISASKSGLHHSPACLGDSGLVRHIAATVETAITLSEIVFFRLTDKDLDEILAALFLHDLCKYGTGANPEEKIRKDHPQLAAKLIEADYPQVARYIKVHMGAWGAHKPGNVKELFVHLADMVASRRFLIADFEHLYTKYGIKDKDITDKTVGGNDNGSK